MFSYYEIIGYTGSVLVALSLSMKNIRLLRQINLIGAFAFSLYGLLINAMPVFVLNGYIVIIDIYYLYKMQNKTEQFKMIAVLRENNDYLKLFLDFYINDILKYFPQFNRKKTDAFKCFLLLRDLRPVGLFIYEEISTKEIKIHLDYVIPDFRDFKSGKYLYSTEIKRLKNIGYEIMSTESDVEKHIKYLVSVGFKKSETNKFHFTKKL